MSVGIPITRSIPVARPFVGGEEEHAVVEVLRTGWVSQGPKVAEFESRFCEQVGAEHAVAVSSCTTGLHLLLNALKIAAGDEVICPSLSFIATANAIAYCGATPVFADVRLDDYNLDPEAVERAITPRTRAILAVHQVGMPADLDALRDIASRHGLLLLEDAACAIGAEYRGAQIGMPHGVAACFSFHPRKVLTTGEGGMITTNDKSLADRLRRMRQHAMSVSDVARHSAAEVVIEQYDEVGFNYRMTDLQAAIGIVQLSRLPVLLERRRSLAARYARFIGGLSGVHPPTEPAGRRSNFQSYMVRIADTSVSRNAVMNRLLSDGISTRRGVMAIHREEPYRGSASNSLLPVTELLADTAIILPLYHQMTDEDQDYVFECLERALSESRAGIETRSRVHLPG